MQPTNKNIFKVFVSILPLLDILIPFFIIYKFFPVTSENTGTRSIIGIFIKYVIPLIWIILMGVSVKIFPFKENKVFILANLIINVPLLIFWFMLMSYSYN